MPILADFLLTDKDTLASQTTGPVNTERIGENRAYRGAELCGLAVLAACCFHWSGSHAANSFIRAAGKLINSCVR